MSRLAVQLLFTMALLSACTATATIPSQIRTQTPWYIQSTKPHSPLLSPGDKLSITFPAAPELSSIVTIGPDGQFQVPYSGPIPAVDQRIGDVRRVVEARLSSELKTPNVEILLVERAAQPIFVGGGVRQPGMYALPGPIDPFQAIMMAGGIEENNTSEVLLIRRMPDGKINSARLDITSNMIGGAMSESTIGWVELRRFDVLHVLSEHISDQDQFVQNYIATKLPTALVEHFRSAPPND